MKHAVFILFIFSIGCYSMDDAHKGYQQEVPQPVTADPALKEADKAYEIAKAKRDKEIEAIRIKEEEKERQEKEKEARELKIEREKVEKLEKAERERVEKLEEEKRPYIIKIKETCPYTSVSFIDYTHIFESISKNSKLLMHSSALYKKELIKNKSLFFGFVQVVITSNNIDKANLKHYVFIVQNSKGKEIYRIKGKNSIPEYKNGEYYNSYSWILPKELNSFIFITVNTFASTRSITEITIKPERLKQIKQSVSKARQIMNK
ncbi:hypothetical protein KKF34_11405 [Myxococcota bacterium]|nr:hypothetical protein [Myxococcota bacterium]MBU1381723.1 hypothetical protein [Myxococcota bacterium]MBU1497470.1 hypothetical protein [Myxococcota bacterium]